MIEEHYCAHGQRHRFGILNGCIVVRNLKMSCMYQVPKQYSWLASTPHHNAVVLPMQAKAESTVIRENVEGQ